MKCFHHTDLDGYCAGHIVSVFENNQNPEDFIEVNYDDVLPLDKISKGERVYFVDYSFSLNTAKVLDKILKITDDVIWVDHHKSSLELLKARPDFKKVKGLVDASHSGALNTYMYLYKCDYEDVPMYIRYVSDYDCWQYNMKDTLAFKYGMDSYKHKPLDDIWYRLRGKRGYDAKVILGSIISDGKVIEGYVAEEKRDYLEKYGYDIDFEGYRCKVCNRRDNSTLFGDTIKDYDIVMIWVFKGNSYEYSIYTDKDNIDCSKLAEKYGGGGHAQAAGFVVKKQLF